MGEPKVDIAATSGAPSRESLSAGLLTDEDKLVPALIEAVRFSPAQQAEIARLAEQLVKAAREGRRDSGGVDSFLHEYGLSSREGVLLLCLAEALLRIPDADNADRLIAGTIGGGDWGRHLGRSESLLVNASTYGLMLTGRVIDWGSDDGADLGGMVQRLIGRSGEPVIRQALRQAMRILGAQFVLGQTIEEALRNAEVEAEAGYRFSFDMLGEAARTADDARRYTARYEEAVAAIAKWAGPRSRPELCRVARAARPLGQALGAASPLSARAGGATAPGAHADLAGARARHARGLAAADHRCRGAGQARAEPRPGRAAHERSGARRLERARSCGAGLWQAGAAADRHGWRQSPRAPAGISRFASSRAPIGTARSNGRKRRGLRTIRCSRAR